MITRSPVATNNKFNNYYLIYYYLNNGHYTCPSTVRILEMSLRKYFTPVPRIGGEDEPPAKRSCTGSPEEADLQEEAYAPPYVDEPGSDCKSTCLGSTTSSTSTPTSSKQSRRFKKDWLSGRQHWLQFRHEIRGMFCLLCQKFNKRPLSNEIWIRCHVPDYVCRVF